MSSRLCKIDVLIFKKSRFSEKYLQQIKPVVQYMNLLCLTHHSVTADLNITVHVWVVYVLREGV